MMISPLFGKAVASSGPDASTLFLTRFKTSTPTDEVSGASGTLDEAAVCNTTDYWLERPTRGTAYWLGDAISDEVTTNWTIEFHTNQPSGGLNGGLLGRCAVAGNNARYIVWYDTGVGVNNRCQFYCTNFGGSTLLLSSPVAFFDGSEHHVAIVRDGTTWRMYRDGVQVVTNTWSGAPTTTTDRLYVGYDPANNAWTSGKIGRVKLSNVARYPSGTTFTPPTRYDL